MLSVTVSALAACGESGTSEDQADGPRATTVELPGGVDVVSGVMGLNEKGVVLLGAFAEGDRYTDRVLSVDLAEGSSTVIDPPDFEGCGEAVPRAIGPSATAEGTWVVFSCFEWTPEERQLVRLDETGAWSVVGERFELPGAAGSALASTVVDDEELVVVTGGRGACIVGGAVTCQTWDEVPGCGGLARLRLAGSTEGVVALTDHRDIVLVSVDANRAVKCSPVRSYEESIVGYSGPPAVMLTVDARDVRVVDVLDGSTLMQAEPPSDDPDEWSLAQSAEEWTVCAAKSHATELRCTRYPTQG
ncbi:MAG: hypothetical protein ABL966_03685 [Acidimicrobiales bacterium]